MNKQKIIFSSLAALLMFSAVGSSAAQDVYVDLSVLETLGGGTMSASEPLFPVIAAQPKAAHKVIKKKTQSKAKAKKPVVKKAPKEESVKIVPKSDIEINDLKPLPKAEAEVDMSSEAAQIKNQPINNEVVEVEVDVQTPENGLTLIPAQTQTAPVSLLTQPAATAESPAMEAPAEAPVQEVVETNSQSLKNEIVFAEGVSELSDKERTQIDALLGGFENPQANKIAIFAYNYENGDDVFKKKRLSLNRAVEIRSYLLGKGYKNFSIKVINVNEADKNNLVTIEELK